MLCSDAYNGHSLLTASSFVALQYCRQVGSFFLTVQVQAAHGCVSRTLQQHVAFCKHAVVAKLRIIRHPIRSILQFSWTCIGRSFGHPFRVVTAKYDPRLQDEHLSGRLRDLHKVPGRFENVKTEQLFVCEKATWRSTYISRTPAYTNAKPKHIAALLDLPVPESLCTHPLNADIGWLQTHSKYARSSARRNRNSSYCSVFVTQIARSAKIESLFFRSTNFSHEPRDISARRKLPMVKHCRLPRRDSYTQSPQCG